MTLTITIACSFSNPTGAGEKADEMVELCASIWHCSKYKLPALIPRAIALPINVYTKFVVSTTISVA